MSKNTGKHQRLALRLTIVIKSTLASVPWENDAQLKKASVLPNFLRFNRASCELLLAEILLPSVAGFIFLPVPACCAQLNQQSLVKGHESFVSL